MLLLKGTKDDKFLYRRGVITAGYHARVHNTDIFLLLSPEGKYLSAQDEKVPGYLTIGQIFIRGDKLGMLVISPLIPLVWQKEGKKALEKYDETLKETEKLIR